MLERDADSLFRKRNSNRPFWRQTISRRVSESGTGENYSKWGDYSVEVKNVSDHVVTNVAVRIVVRTPASSDGTGRTLTTPLPGAVATVRGRAGRGEGTGPGHSGDLVLYLLIASMDMPGCTYEPAKSWPRAARIDASSR
jgi:hypothetical protein